MCRIMVRVASPHKSVNLSIDVDFLPRIGESVRLNGINTRVQTVLFMLSGHATVGLEAMWVSDAALEATKDRLIEEGFIEH